MKSLNLTTLVLQVGIVIIAASSLLPTVHGWSKLNKAGLPFPKVSGHSAISLPSSSSKNKHDNNVVLFGGLTGPAGSPCTDETWEFSTSDKKWTKLLDVGKEKPRVRMYAASATIENDKMLTFGGWDPGAPGSGGDFLKDIWQFDTTTQQWTELDTKLPFPVSRHTACTIPKCGGADGEEKIVLHTYKGILTFDRKDGTLTEQVTACASNNDANDTDNNPDGFSMCAVAPLTDSKMLLFGGSTKTQQLSQDAYVLDTVDWTWTKLDVSDSSDCPPALASACAAPIGDNEVLLFGGASIGPTGYEGGMGLIPQNDTWRLQVVMNNGSNKAIWTKVESSSSSSSDDEDGLPEGRVAASLSPIGPSSFLLQGGYDPLTKTTFDEPWILDL